jgi:hypothetical protein
LCVDVYAKKYTHAIASFFFFTTLLARGNLFLKSVIAALAINAMASETRPVTIDSALILKDVRRTAMLLKDGVTDRVRIIQAFPCLTRAECTSMLQTIHMSQAQRRNLSLWFDRNSSLPIAEVFAAMMRLASRSVPLVSTFF